jgi:hypothetical protein
MVSPGDRLEDVMAQSRLRSPGGAAGMVSPGDRLEDVMERREDSRA